MIFSEKRELVEKFLDHGFTSKKKKEELRMRLDISVI